MAATTFLARREHFRAVGSTNDVVREWLATGTPEPCLATAGEQLFGRGRLGRSWTSPPDASLLLSLGFRPQYLAPERLWRLGAIVALAMADAAEETAGLRDGALRLKWPNDLVAEAPDAPAGVRKLAGVLGETGGLDTDDVRAVVGIGVNTDWPRADFPPELAASMTSLRELSGGRPIDNAALLDAFLGRLEPRWLALRDGRFDVAGWHDRQVTTGRDVCLELPDGRTESARAVGVDGSSGALIVESGGAAGDPGREREVLTADVVHVRLMGDESACDPTARGVTGDGTAAERPPDTTVERHFPSRADRSAVTDRGDRC